MKITIFNGSPHAEKGNTHFMVKYFSQGAKKAGAEIENVFLAKKKIKYCSGCFNCWLKTPGKCTINDDMKKLLYKLLNSDIIIFATPVYVDNVTGIMKTFMDRLIPLALPYFDRDKTGECRHFKRFNQESPKIIVISNCGFPEQSHFKVLKLLFKRIARNMHSRVIAEIYRNAGAALHNPPPILKPFLIKYKKLLKKAGYEVVKNLSLSKKLTVQLQKSIIPDALYIREANKFIKKLLKQFS